LKLKKPEGYVKNQKRLNAEEKDPRRAP
jgi:hypothetical protein